MADAFLHSASWIRDSSFTLYALIRLGFTYEANGEHIRSIDSAQTDRRALAYMDFIFERVRARDPDGSLKIMYVASMVVDAAIAV